MDPASLITGLTGYNKLITHPQPWGVHEVRGAEDRSKAHVIAISNHLWVEVISKRSAILGLCAIFSQDNLNFLPSRAYLWHALRLHSRLVSTFQGSFFSYCHYQ